MKKKFILPLLTVGAVSFGLVSCQQSKGGGDSMPSNATTTDSLLYYLGQLEGGRYINEAKMDTILATPEGRQAFLDGLNAGLNLPKADDDAYNKGLNAGFQLARNFLSFEKEYDVTLNSSTFISSLKATIANDSMPDTKIAQMEFERLVTQFGKQKEEKDRQAAAANLGKDAASKNLPQISSDLYGKITAKTDSAAIKNGDLVKLDLHIKKISGDTLAVPIPPQIRVGSRNMPEVIESALLKMKYGESGEFMSTGIAILGPQSTRMGVESSEPLIFTIKVNKVAEKKTPSADPSDTEG